MASAVLLAASAQQGLVAWRTIQQTQATEARVALLQAKANQVETREREAQAKLQVSPAYAKDAAAIARSAAFPIENVLTTLESAQIGAIKLTALDIESSNGNAYAEVEFSDPVALLHHLQALNNGETRRQWQLVGESVGNSQSPSNAKLTSK